MSIMHGKVQLELDIRPTGDVYLNMWNFQNGADICARVDTENGMLHLDQHDEEFNLLGSQQVHLGDFVRMVQEALLPY